MIGIVIVTFNSANVIKNTLYSCLKQNIEVVVVDNASTDDTLNILNDFSQIHIINNSVNKGIAVALNQGISFLEKKGFVWVLTLDHDTIIPDDYIFVFQNNYMWLSGVRFVSFTPEIIDIKTGIPVMRNKRKEQKICITSGNIIMISVWKELGGFTEKLFIDLVDIDFCFRLRIAGYKILKITELEILHSIGDDTTIVNLFFLKFAVNFHSPNRKYYIARNGIIIYTKYIKHFPLYCLEGLFFLFFEILCSLLRERDIASWRKYLVGLLDGLKHNIKNGE